MSKEAPRWQTSVLTAATIATFLGGLKEITSRNDDPLPQSAGIVIDHEKKEKPMKSQHHKENKNIGIAWLPKEVKQWKRVFVQVAEDLGIDPQLPAIVTLVESRGKPNAVSYANARGLMQVIPETARSVVQEIKRHHPHLAEKLHLKNFNPDKDLFDPETNIYLGSFYFKQQLDRFKTVRRAAEAYHAGPHAAATSDIGPETRAYRDHISNLWEERNRRESKEFNHLIGA